MRHFVYDSGIGTIGRKASRTLRSKEPCSDCTTVAACFVLLLQLLGCAAFLVAWLCWLVAVGQSIRREL